MSKFQGDPDFDHRSIPCTGVLLSNLGTPDAPTPAALRRYLAEFLADPRVVEAPRWLWWLVLHGIILRIRPARAARAYQSIWTDSGSPLLSISKQQAAALQKGLEQRFPGPVRVALGMRYGKPSLKQALAELRAQNAQRILLLPLYPQYSGSTTASTFDAVADELKTWRRQPELRSVQHYHNHPTYINALADAVRETWETQGQAEKLLMSFHGLPKRYLLNGDPYHCECHTTARLLAEALGLADDQWQLAFQSRFGREEWLKPYTDHTLKAWAERGVKRVQVICPGFSSDCLETLEEMAEQNRDIFLNNGGKDYHYIPALNDHVDHIQMLVDLVSQHTQGWPETSADWNKEQRDTALDACKQRAMDKGATS